jgi:hypothetical protein
LGILLADTLRKFLQKIPRRLGVDGVTLIFCGRGEEAPFFHQSSSSVGWTVERH